MRCRRKLVAGAAPGAPLIARSHLLPTDGSTWGEILARGSTVAKEIGQGPSEREELARAFGERLRTLRTRRGLSPEEFESRYDVEDVPTLELGRREPGLSDILALCEGMKVTPNVLLRSFYVRQRAPRVSRRADPHDRDRSAVG
jgi:Helix-turn-helix domain